MAGNNVSFSEFVDRIYKGIPDRTSTVEEKERAIAAKKKILQHPDCPSEKRAEILNEIKTIEGEIAGIKASEHNQAMNSSVFPPRNNLG